MVLDTEKKTIVIDGDASDWTEDMKIAQSAAWDVANHWKGDMRIVFLTPLVCMQLGTMKTSIWAGKWSILLIPGHVLEMVL